MLLELRGKSASFRGHSLCVALSGTTLGGCWRITVQRTFESEKGERSTLAFPGEVKSRGPGAYCRHQPFKAGGRKAFRSQRAETGRELRIPGSELRLHCPLGARAPGRKDILVPAVVGQDSEVGAPG